MGGQTCYSVVDCDHPENVGPDHLFCGSNFCDASYECRAPCPTGYDAECPSGYRCFANTPCNVNARSRSVNMLDYGLPLNVAMLQRRYRASTIEGAPEMEIHGDTEEGSGEMNSAAIVGICFAVVLLLVIGLNVIWWKR